jgi:hypothetical protein
MFPYQELQNTLFTELDHHHGSHIQNVAKLFLKQSLFAKLSPGGLTPNQEAAALSKFISTDQACPEVFEPQGRTAEMFSLFKGYFQSAVLSAMGERSPFEVINGRLRPGPGATAGADGRCFYTKLFEGPLSGTHPWLLQIYRASVANSELWADAEKTRADHFPGFSCVRGNTLFFVPKNKEIARTACTEPNLNMLVQLAIGAFLTEDVLPLLGIVLSKQQPFNRRAALYASASGHMSTIDLSSASDSLSLALVREICPPGLLGLLMSSRSPCTTLPDGSVRELKMISSMGNGFTFPLETLVFACAVKAAYAVGNYPAASGSRDYFVFGDDIICRSEVTEDLIALLGFLGFKVNASKTFTEGPFRESCGVDAWEGTDVRGVFLETLELDHHVYSCINRLNRWAARHSIPLWRTTEFLLSRTKRNFLVPFSVGDCAGVKVPARVSNGATGLYGARRFKELRFLSPRLDVPGDLGYELQGPTVDGGLMLRGVNCPAVELSFVLGYAQVSQSGLGLPIRAHDPDQLWHPRWSSTLWWDWQGELSAGRITTEFWWLRPHEPALTSEQFVRWKSYVAYAFNRIA